MKKLIILASLLMSTSAFAALSGDKIEFQSVSSFVSAAYNDTLCLDGDTYQAVINLCTKWSNTGNSNKCLSSGKFLVSQPMVSTRQRCAAQGGRDGECSAWETVPYVQNPVRTVKYYKNNDRDGGDAYKTETITIPSCN